MTTVDAAAWHEPPLIESPFDQYQRYRIVAEMATARRDASCSTSRGTVLDVGGHHSDFYGMPRRPIAEALPSMTSVTVDLADNPLPGYVRAMGSALPFGSRSFDVVASVDVLEHVPPAWRARVLDEVLRVAASAAIVAAPFRDWRVERAEEIFASFILDTFGAPQQQLSEHRANGLPDLGDTVSQLERAGWSTRVLPYGNLWRWLFMMLDKHALSALPGSRAVHQHLDATYNRERFESDRDLPCYRHFIVATRRHDDPMLAFAETRFGARRIDDIVQPPAVDPAAEAILSLAALHARTQRVIATGEPLRRDTHLVELATHAQNLERGLAAKDAYIAELEQLLRDVESSLTFRLSKQVRRFIPGSSPS